MQKKLHVKYRVTNTLFTTKKVLEHIDATHTVVSFDIETRSIYTKTQRELAKIALKNIDGLTIEEENEYNRVLHSSGLSHPSIVKTTHIILGLDLEESIIIVIDDDERLEKFVFNWLVRTNVKLLIHNASFDLKMVHHRTGLFPKDYEDTQQLAKSLINDCNNYHSRTGLKLLVGDHYPPKWSMKGDTDYEVKDLKNEHFLDYCAIDGSAVLLLWSMLQEEVKGEEDE